MACPIPLGVIPQDPSISGTKAASGELPGMHEAQGKHGPSWLSSFIGKSIKDTQKVGSQLSQNMGKGLGHILGKVLKDVFTGSESSLVTFLGVNFE